MILVIFSPSSFLRCESFCQIYHCQILHFQPSYLNFTESFFFFSYQYGIPLHTLTRGLQLHLICWYYWSSVQKVWDMKHKTLLCMVCWQNCHLITLISTQQHFLLFWLYIPPLYFSVVYFKTRSLLFASSIDGSFISGWETVVLWLATSSLTVFFITSINYFFFSNFFISYLLHICFECTFQNSDWGHEFLNS